MRIMTTVRIPQKEQTASQGAARCREGGLMVGNAMIAWRHFAGAFLCLLIVAVAKPTSGQTYQGRELVKAQLFADTTAIVPGKAFTAGLLLRMAPHWHTYWKFSGDAGLPSEIKWTLPPGWKVGEIQWPIPLKLKDPGDIETYGYENEVLLMQEITPPASIADSSVKLSAEANWLVCERLCIPGSAKLQIELPVADKNAPANEELFSRYRRSLPQNWPDQRSRKRQLDAQR